MRYHFTISYDDGFDDVSRWLRERAANDGLLALGEGLHDQYFVVAAGDERLAKWQQAELDAGRGVAEGVCTIEVFPEASTMRVDLECGEAERETVTNLLDDMFKQFPNYSVYDEDRGEQVTDPVRRSARELIQT